MEQVKTKPRRVFDHLAIARFAGEQGLFHLALLGHVLAADDEVLNLVVGALEWAEGPTDAAGLSVGNAPSGFVRARDLARRCLA